MAYIMDMANGTELTVEAPSYQLERGPGNAPRDANQLTEYPQLQLAIVELQTQAEAATFPASVVDATLKTLED
ncbi:hypothetical protein MNBD_GAMMA15-590 [hydrothermal vent metagenome]|uniref:Uncharacterized protein n=1 Tax=hydrothermal vent metagenome TaxID=652676 RepID=A0A3B0YSS6_9ZZZZ